MRDRISMKASLVALGVMLGVGGVSISASPAAAQASVELTRSERAALAPLVQAVQARNWAAAAAAAPAARSAASSDYARYLVGAYMQNAAIATGDMALQASAIDLLLSSNALPAAQRAALMKTQVALIARNETDPRRLEASLARFAEAMPNDPDVMLALVDAKARLRKGSEALSIMARAIELRRTTGQPVPEAWYKRAVELALANRSPDALRYSRELVATYPNAVNWRDALMTYREFAGAEPTASIDAWRLQRQAKALAGERDYQAFAQALSGANLAAESKAVLDDGVAARMVDPAEAQFKALIAASAKAGTTQRAGLAARQSKALAGASGAEALTVADATFAAGDHAKAAELYAAAVQKGGVDANLANQRLGMALALAGRRAEAEAALRSVTGSRAELASLWLTWLTQRG
jgi:hypothetical protein